MSLGPLDDIRQDEELTAAVERETRRLRQQVSSLTDENKTLRQLADFVDSVNTAPIAVPSWYAEQESNKHAGVVVAQIADWHLDEVVKPDEIFMLNAYNRDIAMQRIKRWAEKLVTLPRQYMTGIEFEGLSLLATGDLFTGEIHHELKESNEARLLESVLYWMEPVIASLELFEREYPSVVVECVVGNHGRLAEKSVFKGRVYDNVEWLFWSVLKARLTDRHSTVQINVSTSMDLNVPLYGRNHLINHGDGFKGGTGISGAYAPLSLGSHRKNRRQMRAGMPMETMVLGHFHQLINIPGVIMGGTLKGYDEYAFGLNLDPDPNGAAQSMWVTTPERAQVIWMPIYVQDRLAEGW